MELVRSKRKVVEEVNIGEIWCTEPKEMKSKMFSFFNNYFSCQPRLWRLKLEKNFSQLEGRVASSLEEPFSKKEIQEVWECDKSKAPGPDGFNLFFFKRC